MKKVKYDQPTLTNLQDFFNKAEGKICGKANLCGIPHTCGKSLTCISVS